MNLTNTTKTEQATDCNTVYTNSKTSKNCFSCSVEKLLTNMSNKLGLSLAIYQK